VSSDGDVFHLLFDLREAEKEKEQGQEQGQEQKQEPILD
jgi:hypothetical protein